MLNFCKIDTIYKLYFLKLEFNLWKRKILKSIVCVFINSIKNLLFLNINNR